jgi:chemotaxis protein methyltransferase CheR
MLADRGDLLEALSHCEGALEHDKLDPSLHYLKASILQALGRANEAERALQSTLFLDGNFALARVMLGAIARGQSRPGDASKHFREALALLERMPSDSVLPETDGLTAGKMAETVASLIESECVL